jgi:PAS domain S-box-containing protein
MQFASLMRAIPGIYPMAPIALHDQLIESAQRIAAFVDALPVPLFRTTLEGEIVFCNAAMAHAFGYESAGELVGSQVTRLYRNQKDRGRLIRRILTHRCVRNYVLALKRRDGSPVWFAVTAQADLDDEDMVIHLDGVLWDVTERVAAGKIEAQSAAAANPPVAAEDHKFAGVLEMAGGVAHLLSQPLTVATNLVNELATDADATEAQMEKIQKIRAQIEKINEITRKVAKIHTYATMDYVAGVKIVDIERASTS